MTVDEYLAAGGKITRCPTRYCATSQQAQLTRDEERKRLRRIRIREDKDLGYFGRKHKERQA